MEPGTCAVGQRAAAAAPSRISRTGGFPGPYRSPLDGLEAIDKAPALLDAWLHDVASAAPVVLLTDDLHLADEIASLQGRVIDASPYCPRTQ
ncbi:MAG: hypothetical protein WAN44_00735 [Propionibacteriaceae bacterium]